MRFGRTLVSFIGLTVTLLSAELWLMGGLAAQRSRIVFTHLGFDNFEIYVVDADGGNRENLSNHPVDDMDPDWSPDGSKIAFVSNRHDGIDQIHVMDADGKNQIRLTYGRREKRFPDWSPDGGTIAYIIGNEGIFDGARIHLMNADGKYLKQLSDDHHGIDYQPDFGPVGLAISPTAVSPAFKTATLWGRLKTRTSNIR